MSAEVATGCCSSWVQGVSVVPISQYLDHGMMNRTDFSVCRIRPTSPRIRSRGTTMWMPLEASTRSPPSAPDSDSVSSVQTPVELITARARIAMLLDRSRGPRRPRRRPLRPVSS